MEEVTVSDYIFSTLYEKYGIDTVFTVTGGGAMFLNDSLARNKNITTVFCHHEQACAMAALGYYKETGKPAGVLVTTGCGGTNAITGILDAWQDSSPVVVISGQVNLHQTSFNKDFVRQLGVQEADIISVVRSVTKYSHMVSYKEEISSCIRIAMERCLTGRKGPVWLDVPLDIQSSKVIIKDKIICNNLRDRKVTQEDLLSINGYLQKSERPVFLVGNGCRDNSSLDYIDNLSKKHNIPIVATFLAVDLFSGNENFIGSIGVKGTRASNFTIQNSDLVIAVGTRLSIPTTGYRYDYFARDAKILVIDIDKSEHLKNTVAIEKIYNYRAELFLSNVESKSFDISWLKKCKSWRSKWDMLPQQPNSGNYHGIDLYYFIFCVNSLEDTFSLVSDAGSAYYVSSQFFRPKSLSRYITSGAQADMGFSIPASVGASFANREKKIIAITGDGSFQMNIQELQTIKHYNLPIKIFVWNNNGYLSIKNTQDKFFDGRRFGTDAKTGISFPSVEKICYAYDLKYVKIESENELSTKMKKIMSNQEPVICEVICREDQQILPTIGSVKVGDKIISRPLEDMYPFLEREELRENMIIETIKEEK